MDKSMNYLNGLSLLTDTCFRAELMISPLPLWGNRRGSRKNVMNGSKEQMEKAEI